MEKLNEYLQTLLSTCSYELHLEPNRTPYVLNAGGQTDVANTPLLGTQISTIIFPLIPAASKQHLPNQSEIEFVHAHKLGNFSFLVRKSPAGFNVTIRPIFSEDGVPAPLINSGETINTNAESTESPNYYNPPKHISSFNNIVEEKNTAQENKTEKHLFGNLSNNEATSDNSYNYESSLGSVDDYEIEIQDDSSSEVETVSVYDPQFATTFSDNAKYEPPIRPQEFKMEYETPKTSQPQSSEQSQKYHLLENFEDYDNLPQSDSPSPPKSSASVSGSQSSGAQNRMNNLFRLMSEVGASDLHMSVSMPPMVRKDGKMAKLECS